MSSSGQLRTRERASIALSPHLERASVPGRALSVHRVPARRAHTCIQCPLAEVQASELLLDDAGEAVGDLVGPARRWRPRPSRGPAARCRRGGAARGRCRRARPPPRPRRRRARSPRRCATCRRSGTLTSTCGSRVITAPSSASDCPGRGHPVEHVQRGEDAVAGGRVAAHDHVAGLLPAEGEAGELHRLEHVAVTHLGLAYADPGGLHRLDEAEVAHHGGHDGVVVQLTGLPHRQREDRQDLVTVDDLAARRPRRGTGRRRRRGRTRRRRRARRRPSGAPRDGWSRSRR